MNIQDKKWELPDVDWSKVSLLTKELAISPVTAQVLLNRGIDSSEEAKVFLQGTLKDLSSPWDLPGMEEAVLRIKNALRANEKILIYGDYDVDGITATAILVSFFRDQGATVGYYIPDRSDGYGLNIEAIDSIRDQGYALVVTVDCGISAVKEIVYGRELGLDFVVTDHHEPGTELPSCPVVNPKLSTNKCGAMELAGVGVAFKLIQALAESLGADPVKHLDYLDLVALGTIADVVPLVGENRLLVKHGLLVLNNTPRVGIKALCEVASVKQEELTATQVAFVLAPRLNAAGRMASSLTALELLLTDSIQKAGELARYLHELNCTRQLLVQQVMNEAESLIIDRHSIDEEMVLVLASPLWHSGVIGIVASKLTEKYFRPVILLTIEGEQAKGSGRSIPGFDLFRAISNCNDLLLTAGGHSQAVGVTLATNRIDDFRCKINEYALSVLEPDLLKPSLQLEAEVLMEHLDLALVDELAQLEPFGHGNPEPLLAVRQANLKEYRRVGKDGSHLKLQVETELGILDGIGFRQAQLLDGGFNFEVPVDIAFKVERNQWNGKTNVQLIVEDLKEHHDLAISDRIPVDEVTAYHRQLSDFEVSGIYPCVHGREQFQLMVDFILTVIRENRRVCLLFPSQRMLAVYEKLLSDSLIRYNVTCQRLNSWNPNSIAQLPAGQVILAVNGMNLPKEECKFLKLVFAGGNEEAVQGKNLEACLLGFKEIESQGYDFIRKPVLPTDKLAYIEPLVRNQTGTTFVYTNKKKQVMELYHGLLSIFPHKKHKIWYYHQGLCLTQKEIILEAAAFGMAEVIIANEFLELQLPEEAGAGERIIVDAPYSVDELFLKARPHRSPVTVHGIWHDSELAFNETTLNTIFPQDQALETLLQAMKELGATREYNLPGIMDKLKNKGARLQWPTVQYALAILDHVSLNYKEAKVYQAAEAEKKALARLRALDLAGINEFKSLMLRGTP